MTTTHTQAVEAAVRALPNFKRQDDYLLAGGASIMSENCHEIIHIDTVRKIVAAALTSQQEVAAEVGAIVSEWGATFSLAELDAYTRAAIQQAAVPETEDLRELLAKAPRLHAMLTMGGCPSCGSKDCIALSCQLEPTKQQPALGRGDGGGVPLTDDEIKAICKAHLVEGYSGDYLEDDGFHLARAIEAAHGIVKAPTGQINPDSAGQGMEADHG